MVGSLIYIFVKKETKTKEGICQVQNVLQRFQPLFEEKGLRWNIPQSFPLYIELCRDYRERLFEHPISYNPQTNIQLSSIAPSNENQTSLQTESSEK